jgi:hypothetical protein
MAASQKADSSKGILAYSKASPHPSSFLLRSPRGITYRLSLVPERDVRQQVVVLDLVLQKQFGNGKDTNLLDTTGKLHGYQPYVLAASDFANGAQESRYGEVRMIDLAKIGIKINVKVAEVHVKRTSAASPQALNYEFDDLTLEIATGPSIEGRDSRDKPFPIAVDREALKRPRARRPLSQEPCIHTPALGAI